MPQSEPTLLELCEQLDGSAPSNRPEIGLYRYFLEDPDRWLEISDTAVEILVPNLDASNPTVRSEALFVLGHVGAHGGKWNEFSERTITQSEIVERILDAFDDENKTVRQAATGLFHLEAIVDGVLSGDIDVASERIATKLFTALHDSSPTVRKRVGKIFYRHGVDLLVSHPETENAVASLIEALADPVDGLGLYQYPAISPRRAALTTLREGIDHYDPAVLGDHVNVIPDFLEDEQKLVRIAATALLDELYHRGVIPLEQVVDEVLAAIERNQYPKCRHPYDRLALAVGLGHPGSVWPVYEHFWSEISLENTQETWFGNESLLVALSRLVRASDASFDPPIETLAEITAWDTTACKNTDPLVLIASAHPEFVGSQLRDSCRKLVAGEIEYPYRSRNLIAEWASENLTAIDDIPEILAEDITNRDVRETLTAFVEAHPEQAAPVVPAAFDRGEWESPLSYQNSELIETTAEYWSTVPDTLVEVLVETVGDPVYETRRRCAIRALVALHDQGLSVLPSGFEPFVRLCHEGVFEDDEGTDPLDTEAAESAGLV